MIVSGDPVRKSPSDEALLGDSGMSLALGMGMDAAKAEAEAELSIQLPPFGTICE